MRDRSGEKMFNTKVSWDLRIPNLVWTSSRNDDSFSNMLLKCPWFDFWKQWKMSQSMYIIGIW